MDVLAVSEEKQLGQVIEDHTDTVVVEAVAEPVRVAVVHPLTHPDSRLGLGILCLILQIIIRWGDPAA